MIIDHVEHALYYWFMKLRVPSAEPSVAGPIRRTSFQTEEGEGPNTGTTEQIVIPLSNWTLLKRRGGDMTNSNFNKPRIVVVMVALTLVLGFAQAGHATLALNGPVDPANGYPQFYTDFGGLSLMPCIEVAPTPCLPVGAAEGVDPLQPIVFPNNFPVEFFYWIASPDFTAVDTNGNVTVIEFALEGAFGNEIPEAGQQAVFARKRVRLANLTPGTTVTVTHPFGEDNFVVDAVGVVNVTSDEPPGIPLDFVGVLASNNIGPTLLRWDPAAPPLAPAGYVGDAAIPHTVTGGPNGNIVTVSGGGLAAPLTTDLWSVAGKLFAGAAPGVLSIDRATYAAAGTAINLDVFATSTAGATVTVSGTPEPATPVLMTGDAVGKFFVSTPVASIPTNITVSSTPPGGAATVLGATPQDLVIIDRVFFNSDTGILTVNASSSDQRIPGPTLTAVGFGDLISGVGIFTLAAGSLPPAAVTINSSAGGTHTQPVNVVGGGVPAPNSDTVTITRATFAGRSRNWSVNGRAGAGATVTVSLGNQIVGNATASTRGTWRLLSRGSAIIPNPNAAIRATSSIGGVGNGTVTVRGAVTP